MLHAPLPAGLPSAPDPDRAGKPVPEAVASFLAILHILRTYGEHLAATLESRAAHRSFVVIARCFGTSRIGLILAHITRGLRRAVALERVLLARAARGRDIMAPEMRRRAPLDHKPSGKQSQAGLPPPTPDAAADPATPSDAAAPPHPAASPDAATQPATTHRRRSGPEEPPDLAHLPSVAELEAQIRRRPLARALADICSDLGVVPGLCTTGFWNRLFEAMVFYDGGFPRYFNDMLERRQNFARSDAAYGPALQWSGRGREDTRQALGFFIGEEPVDPFAGQAPAPPPTSETLATTSETLAAGTLPLDRPQAGTRLSVPPEAGLLPAGFATGPP